MKTLQIQKNQRLILATVLAAVLGTVAFVFLAFVPSASAQVTKVEELEYPALPDVEVPQPKRVELNSHVLMRSMPYLTVSIFVARNCIRPSLMSLHLSMHCSTR